MPKMAKSDRQAKRIPKSSGHECLRRSSRKGRPHEYLKAPGTNAANAQVGREGPTNTKKFRAQMPQAVKSEGNAIRIPKSTRHKCLRRSSRKGRPHEYLKAQGTNASGGQVEREGHTNTSKFRAQMPQAVKSEGQAQRIPKSSGRKCHKRTSRTGGQAKSNRRAKLFPCHQCHRNDNKRDSQYFPESEEGMEEEEGKDDGR